MRPDSHRRKWDKDEFEKLARDRLRDEEDDEAEAGPSTSKGGASKRDHSDDEEGNFDNLVTIFKL
jgi:U4/U6.U5 tri-snRNP component SNU23